MKKLEKGATPSKVDTKEAVKPSEAIETDNIEVKSDSKETIPGFPDVTAKPRPDHPEDPDLTSVMDNPEAVRAIVDACDDQGETLRDTVLEQEVKSCCEKYSHYAITLPSEKISLDDPESILAELVDISNRYVGQINSADNTIQGVVTKYRIRLGVLFNIQKRIIEDCTKFRWVTHIEDNYEGGQLRSIQDYMRLARVPDIIGYAALGKERLLQIVRLIEPRKNRKTGQYKDDYPIRRFLSEHDCNYNPKEESDIAGMKRDADITVGHEYLIANNFGEFIKRPRVKQLVDSKLEVGSKFVRELKVLEKTFKDNPAELQRAIDKYIDGCIADRKINSVPTPEREVRKLNSKVKNLLEKAEENINKPEVYNELDVDKLSSLLEKLQELSNNIASVNNS